MTGLYNNTWKKSFIIYFKKAKVMGCLFVHYTTARWELVCGGVCVWRVCVCVFCYRSTIPCYRLSDFLIILGFLHWKNKKEKFTFSQHSDGIPLKPFLQICLLLPSCVWCCSSPIRWAFFSSLGDWAKPGRGGVAAGRGAGRRSRDLYCVHLSVSK